jgi:hypothetical protein
MKPYQTLTLPDKLVEQFGPQFKGTYTVHLLNAKEYLQTAEELTLKKRQELQKQDEVFNGQISEIELRTAIVYKAVTKDDNPLPEDIPSKLYEILAYVAIPLNMLNQDEGVELLKLFRSAKGN